MEQGENLKVVTRFAPSPTGFMHVGGVHTALYAWLWARKNGGKFILRIEDTDKEREVAGSIEHIQESLKWLGIDWDYGPGVGGPNAPYIQSQRLDIYKKYAYKLIELGFAYPDPFTEEEVEILRQKAEAEKRPFLYREHRGETTEAWDEKKPLRFRVPEIKESKWNDVVFGDLSAGPEALDDMVIIKSDGYPTYNFAHIVDDIEMGVTHVMRGIEFIASTPKFLAVYEALGVRPPIFATLSPIMAPDGKKKLSKRDGAKDTLEYRKEGYLPDGFINFLALLGWHPKPEADGTEKEIFTREELIQIFDIYRVKQSGAGFDDKKLDWVNREHIKMLKGDDLENFILSNSPSELKSLPPDTLKRMVPMIADRITKGSDIGNLTLAGEFNFVLCTPEFSKEKLMFKNTDPKQIIAHIEQTINILSNLNEDEFTFEKIKELLMGYADTLPSRGELLHPIRFALSGQDRSPDPFIIATVLGKNETIKRLQKAIA